jgi:hypothetical protein
MIALGVMSLATGVRATLRMRMGGASGYYR